MDLALEVAKELEKMQNMKWVDCRQMPCLVCTVDSVCIKKMGIISSTTNNSYFSKPFVGTFDDILHGESSLNYGDNSILLGIKVLADKVANISILKMCRKKLQKRNDLASSILNQSHDNRMKKSVRRRQRRRCKRR